MPHTSHNNDLTKVVLINEIVKQVETQAGQLYLTGLNAMFKARNASGNSLGFASVTKELRQFSAKLNHNMEELTCFINEMITKIALSQKQHRQHHLLYQALTISNGDPHHLDRLNNRINDVSHQISKLRDQLFSHLGRVEKLCNFGDQLAVLAKVEAMGTKEYAKELLQVADKITEIVEKIHGNIKNSLNHFDNAFIEKRL